MEAATFLARIEGQRKPDMTAAPQDMITKGWRRLVLPDKDRVVRWAYTFCLLEQLRDALRRHDVYVMPSTRWGDTRAKLLQGADWEAARPQICRTLGRSADPQGELEKFRTQLDRAYQRTLENLPANDAVRIARVGDKDTLVLTPLDKLDDPPSLRSLRVQVARRLPRADLPEVLLEIHAQTGFADAFTHISESNARVEDLATSICAVLLAEACNIGLRPLVRRDVPALTRERLLYVQQNYLRAETIARANVLLVEAQTRIALAHLWGGGEVASADGLRFVVPVSTLNAGFNAKYFGRQRGVTLFNFTADLNMGFYHLVVPGTIKDSLYVLAGLLEQQTSLRPTEIMTDTGSYTDLVFGLFLLLGYRFSPRLADLGDMRFWRLDRDADYGALNDIAAHRVRPDLITRHWDDLLRVAGSLQMHTVQVTELMRALQGGGRMTTLAQAITEVGRIGKTLHLLSYIDDEALRRRILVQLNRQERRHSLARAVFHGQRGELRQRYREGQEDQLGALGLVVNIMVLWTTGYMDQALTALQADGVEVRPEDAAHLSPLGHRHLNLLGQYHFTLPQALARGERRPLRDPATIDDEDTDAEPDI